MVIHSNPLCKCSLLEQRISTVPCEHGQNISWIVIQMLKFLNAADSCIKQVQHTNNTWGFGSEGELELRG